MISLLRKDVLILARFLQGASAAAMSRTRSITRFRFGAPSAAKVRLKCSRVTPRTSASTCVRTGRPDQATMQRHAPC